MQIKNELKNPCNKERKWLILFVNIPVHVYEKLVLLFDNLCFEKRYIEIIRVSSNDEALEKIKQNNQICIAIINHEQAFPLIKEIREELNNTDIRLATFSENTLPKDSSLVSDAYYKYDIFRIFNVPVETFAQIILLGIRYYKDFVTLKREDEAYKSLVHFYSKSSQAHNKKDFLINWFNVISDFLKKVKTEANIITFLNGKYFISTKEFEQYKHTDYNDFLASLLEGVDEQLQYDRIVWLDKKSVVIFLNNLYDSIIYIRLKNRYISSHLRKTFTLLFRYSIREFESIVERSKQEKELNEIIYMLAELVENRSEETGEHVYRVKEYTKIIARTLEIKNNHAKFYTEASILHDIGKIGVPDKILHKPSRLTSEEFEIMKEHTTIGNKILKRSNDRFFEIAARIAHYHHENWDGSGYPTGLKGREIPIEARIVSLSDYYDALGSDRVYRKAWEEKRILDSIKELKGIKFDPKVVDAFFKNYHKILAIKMRFFHKKRH